LGVGDFLRSYSVVHYTEQALAKHRSAIMALIRPELMKAHMLSVQVRGESS
jgi:histidinol dehydrogenase